MSLTATCPACGSRAAQLPRVCRNDLCCRFGLRVDDDFQPSPSGPDTKGQLSFWQFSVRDWAVIVIVLAVVSAAVVYFGPLLAILGPLLLGVLAFVKWRGVEKGLMVALFALLAIGWFALLLVLVSRWLERLDHAL